MSGVEAAAHGKMRPMRGLFVTFEGPDGSGKTTQVERVCRELEERGVPFVRTREPGGTPLADDLRRLLLRGQRAVAPRAELLMMTAARADHVRNVIRPALGDGKVVICDRFSDSTVAYQGYGRGLPIEQVRTADEIATEGLKQDMTFLIDVPSEIGLARVRNGRETAPDRFEEEELEFHSRIREGYLAIWKEEPARVVLLDGRKSPDELTPLIMGRLELALNTLFERKRTKGAEIEG